jgi:uncharacterized protein (DUF1697 family)
MNRCIALLRAVNVGGTGKLPMAVFRKLLADLGYTNIETYIQSGNAVFDTPCLPAESALAIAAALQPLLGSAAAVLVRTHEQLGRVIAANPFVAEAAAEGGRVHAVFLSATPALAAVPGLSGIPVRRERFHIAEDTLYLHLPDGAADTKFTAKAIERLLGVTTTTRNWNTVLKLHAMSKR